MRTERKVGRMCDGLSATSEPRMRSASMRMCMLSSFTAMDSRSTLLASAKKSSSRPPRSGGGGICVGMLAGMRAGSYQRFPTNRARRWRSQGQQG